MPPLDVPFLEREPDGPTRHLALGLAYRGDGFLGWQVQPKGLTVQGALEKALTKLCDQPIRVAASGRTDTGVNAWGQVASFATTSTLSLERMLRGLRSLLPPGVWPRALGPVPRDFHARFSAQGKTYHYYLWPQAQGGLFLDGLCWPLRGALELEPMARALAGLVGPVDMAAFASAGSEPGESTMRQLYRAELSLVEGGLVEVRLTASGFLRHSVRNLVGSLVQVGQGRLEPSGLARMAQAGKRLRPGPKAPPHGLYLARVFYTDSPV
ncbi:MAG: tRNA pseudouridine(38-40) synthase TruA [Proteobacteria bacterium]|nr:tRNA pseudouridine(38-40) synthase TruA [Pseudomonadota bacterium]MBU1453071.1 tRNA pseudouridine(38-40) synthase TruA [Pseudomonadota bacterium]MBU2467123.1 tRNA pseudouridine(38-40) synthase TruA [Pseudomonadota bacterium]MBU2518876.1 tRNA pseudouridine(38-40) synthase TruA [Pseudomonadota bacterium]